MGTVRKAYRINENNWEPVDETKYTFTNSGDRHARKIAIGTETAPGSAEHYVCEMIYEDLLPMIFSGNATVHLNLYAEPMIVLEKNGKLLLHNGSAAAMKDDIFDILEELDKMTSNQIRALVEIRNNQYSQNTLGQATKLLRNVLWDETGIKFSYDFIRLCLKEKFMSQPEKGSLEWEFSTYSKEDLISIYGSFLEIEETNATRIEPAKTLLDKGVSLDELRRLTLEEIGRRFFEGGIH